MNLTKTSILFKRWFKIIFLVLAVYYGWIFFGGPGFAALYKLLVNVKEPPNPIYGQLDPLEFTAKEISGKDIVYKLNTKNGKLPGKIPYKMNVYKFKPRVFSYLAGDNAIKNAAYIGYTDKDLISDLKGTVYKWRKLDLNSYLEIDINNGRLLADSDMIRNSALMQRNRINEDIAKKNALAFFQRLERTDDLYNKGIQKVTFGYVGGTRLLATTSAKDTQFARIDLFRSIDEFPIVGPDRNVGLLNVYFTVTNSNNSLITTYPKANAYFREIDTVAKASYPIIDVSVAWNAVKEGKGVVTSVIPSNSSIFDRLGTQEVQEILVDNIYLAYYENTTDQMYLQPIYVFEAKYKSMATPGGSITMYVPAVSGEYVKPVNATNSTTPATGK